MKIRSLRMLRHFLTVSRTGNLHRAASEEALSQSAITKSIQQLESILGVPLFDRTPKGVVLTAYGQIVQKRAKRMAAECSLMEREVLEMHTGQAGRLRIAAGSVWSTVLLPQIVSTLNQRKPTAEFSIVQSTGSQFLELFENNQIDVALGALDSMLQTEKSEKSDSLSLSIDTHTYEPLTTIETQFFAREGHPLHALNRVTAHDIAEYSLAFFRSDIELQMQLGVYFSSHGLHQPAPALLSDSISGVMESLRCSTMVTCLPGPLRQYASSFGVGPLRMNTSPWTFQSGIIMPATTRGYPLLEEFVLLLKQALADSEAFQAGAAHER